MPPGLQFDFETQGMARLQLKQLILQEVGLVSSHTSTMLALCTALCQPSFTLVGVQQDVPHCINKQHSVNISQSVLMCELYSAASCGYYGRAELPSRTVHTVRQCSKHAVCVTATTVRQ
jgi:hypothetical protein